MLGPIQSSQGFYPKHARVRTAYETKIDEVEAIKNMDSPRGVIS
jgi:hypothetical protein